nr:hypothetical protein [Sphingomonas sp. CDS-1]
MLEFVSIISNTSAFADETAGRIFFLSWRTDFFGPGRFFWWRTASALVVCDTPFEGMAGSRKILSDGATEFGALPAP